MIAADELVDPWRAPEFTPAPENSPLGKSTLVQIGNQCCKRLIERHIIVLDAAGNGPAGVAMMVPASDPHRNDSGASLNEAPRKQQALAELMIAVALFGRDGFFADVKSFVSRGAGKHLQGLPLQLVDRIHRLPLLALAGQAVERCLQCAAVLQPIEAKSGLHFHANRLAVGIDGECVVGVAQILRTAVVSVGNMDIGRQAPMHRAANLSDDRADRWIIVRQLIFQRGAFVACLAVARSAAVARIVMAARADQRIPMSQRSQLGQRLTDLDAGHAGRDWTVWPANIERGLGLWVERLKM